MNGATGYDAVVLAVILLAAIQGVTIYAIAKVTLTGRSIVEAKESGHNEPEILSHFSETRRNPE